MNDFHSDELARLVDKDAIRDVLARYARGVDRCDWDMVRSAYHDDAHDNHGGYQGGVTGLIEWIRRRHIHIEQSMHMLGNCLIDFHSPTHAIAETYCASYQRYGEAARETIRLWIGDVELASDEYVYAAMTCRYVDRMEKRDGIWRIAGRVVIFEDVKAVKATSLLSDTWVLAKRDYTDRLWEMERDAAIAPP